MCTVTYLPINKHNFILTSNRDEQATRITFPPKMYHEGSIEMMYPKDKVAGGTWIGASTMKRLVCVLNGAFIKHKRKLPYSKSRGIIAKEILAAEKLVPAVQNLSLVGVEPFTMVIVDWNNEVPELSELIWDTKTVYFSSLKNEPKIWSSSTLYTDEIKEVRKKWFSEWLKSNKLNNKSILSFHHSEIGDKSQSVLMKRSYVETVSITSVIKKGSDIVMNYEDVIHSKKWNCSL